jgi:hypothetical protein
MKKLLGILLFAVFVLSFHSAFAAISGNDLIDGMRVYLKADKDYTKADYLLAGNYLGYVQGVADATASDYSMPDGVTADQLCQIVAKFLEKHPERWNEPAFRLVRIALQEAFPSFLLRNR